MGQEGNKEANSDTVTVVQVWGAWRPGWAGGVDSIEMDRYGTHFGIRLKEDADG